MSGFDFVSTVPNSAILKSVSSHFHRHHSSFNQNGRRPSAWEDKSFHNVCLLVSIPVASFLSRTGISSLRFYRNWMPLKSPFPWPDMTFPLRSWTTIDMVFTSNFRSRCAEWPFLYEPNIVVRHLDHNRLSSMGFLHNYTDIRKSIHISSKSSFF